MATISTSPLYAGYLAAFTIAALTCFWASWRAGQIPYGDTRKSLVTFFLTSGLWAASYIGFLLPVGFFFKHFFYQGSLIVGFGTVWAWLWFCSAYSGRALHRSSGAQRFAAGLFLTVVLLKLTNPAHGLYYSLEATGAGPFGLIVRHQILYWVVMGVSYALATAGYLMLFELFSKTQARTGPLAFLTALTALPAVLNIVGHVSPNLRDLTHEPLGVTVFAVGVLFAYTYQFEAVRLAGSLQDPTIILDQEGRVRDFDEQSTGLLSNLTREDVIGKPLASVVPSLAERLRSEDSVWETPSDESSRYYRIIETSLGNGSNRDHRLVVLSDITERERREKKLASRQEKVEALYAAVSQLLRAEGKREVGEVVVRLINEVFGHPLVGVRFAKNGQLLPIQHSPEVSREMPSRPPVEIEGESLIAQAYQTDEPVGTADLQNTGGPLDYGKARGAAFFPIGEHGTISVGQLKPGEIEAFDHYLIEVLSAHTSAVLSRIDQESQLREAKVEAQEASRMKSALLANMSHEVRTPLTSIIGFAEQIGQISSEHEGPVDRFAEVIEKSSRRLLGTLDAVLNLSRLEAGEIGSSDQPTDLSMQAREVAGQFEGKAREKEVDLHVQVSEEAVWTNVGRDTLEIILQNLISNAIKYTEAGGSVWVRTRQDDNRAVLDVEDTGIGMNAEKASQLFQPFRQESEGLNREYEGAGLGLTVTKRAVEEAGGSIDFETEKGEGSRFTVWLPNPETENQRNERTSPPTTEEE